MTDETKNTSIDKSSFLNDFGFTDSEANRIFDAAKGLSTRRNAIDVMNNILFEKVFPAFAEMKKELSDKSICMGVGDGSGRLFVYGDYESIKAAQATSLEKELLFIENKNLKEKLEKYSWDVDDDDAFDERGESDKPVIFTDEMYNQLMILSALEIRSRMKNGEKIRS